MAGIGIHALGMYLPPEVRSNAWWPAEVTAAWLAARPQAPPPSTASAGADRVSAAIAALAADPFQGAVERHVMAAGMSHIDMEVLAARAAIEAAGVDPAAIDLLLVQTLAPEAASTNLACEVHAALGLPPRCIALEADAAQYSFMVQLSIAEAMIASGRARHALLVQSTAASRVLDPRDPISPIFGDGATAAVIGRVAGDHGVLAQVHHVDGRYGRTLITSVPSGSLYDDGRAVLHIGDPVMLGDLMRRTADVCRDSIAEALALAGHRGDEVDFLCMHQGTAWLREVVQEHAGLTRARSVDTFARTGHLHGALLVSELVAAEREQLLGSGDLVVVVGGGTGMSFGASVLRWGR